MPRKFRWTPRPLTRGEILSITAILAIVGIPYLMFMLVQKDYGCDWTGFGACPTPSGELRAEKTLWDWMELLLVPLVLALGGLWYNWTEKRSDRRIAQDRAENDQRLANERADNDRAIAERHAQDAALQTYLDQMTDLLLEYNLSSPDAKPEAVNVARVRTLTAVRRLNAVGIGAVFRFLYDAGLTRKENDPVIGFSNVDFSGLNLSDIWLIDTNLYRAKFDHIECQRAFISMCDLNISSWKAADLSETIFRECGLRSADFENANLVDTAMVECDLTDIKLTGANIVRLDVSRSDLEAQDLRGVNFASSKLDATNLRRCDLRNVNFQNANLEEAQLNDANLEGANLRGSQLYNAFLGGANLTNANLEGANLQFAYFTGANLRGATVSKEQLQTASSLEKAILPDGTVHP